MIGLMLNMILFLPKHFVFVVEFHRVVLDEAHQIKGRNTKTAKACYAIDAVRRWVLTGTPIQNKLEDLFSLVHFLRSEPWSNFSFWRTFITIPFESKDKDKAMKVVTSVLEPLVLRRTKATKDENGNPIIMLPEKIVDIEYLEFTDPENDIYQALFKDGKTKFNHYCRAGTVLKHYASIFQLLMRYNDVKALGNWCVFWSISI
jgi:DNA repair protein RAD5